MPTDKPKIIFIADDELLERLDDYRFESRINSRSEAIRLLIDEDQKEKEVVLSDHQTGQLKNEITTNDYVVDCRLHIQHCGMEN